MEEEKCPFCGSKIIEYDDFIEYGEGTDANEGEQYVKMCSNPKCKGYNGL